MRRRRSLSRRSRSPRRGRHRDGGDAGGSGGPPPPPPPPPAMQPFAWPGFPPGGWPAGFPPPFGGEKGGDAEKDKDKKKKKKKKKRKSSSSSSSSSSESDWRQKVWNSGMMGQMQQMWPQMAAMGQGGASGGQPPMWQWPADPSASSNQWEPPPDRGMLDGGQEGSSSSARAWRAPDRDRSPSPPPGPAEDVPIFLEPAIEEYVPVPKALLGKVIGKQASTIIEIREKSGAFKVDARDQTSDPCQVKVAGTAEAVKKARELINELVESARNKHAGSEYVEIPRAKIGMVIGLKGAQVNEIQIQTGTKIDVDFEADPCKCYIKGPSEAIDRAKKILLTIAMQIEDDSSEYIDLPKATSGAVIGAQGSRVREFQEASGARIDVDKTGPTCRVRLTGNSHQINHAKELIMAEVQKAAAPRPQAIMPGPSVIQPMVVPAHQPTSFPATLSESIARAKAAAEAVKNGLITGPPQGMDAGQFAMGGFQEPAWGGMQGGW